MREITGHKVNECNEAISIAADERDEKNGNASHLYTITVPRHTPPGSAINAELHPIQVVLPFQHGPIKEAGVNGITNEALLAVVADRLEGFQAGPYACVENERALEALHLSIKWLLQRTRARVARGVEGTNEK